MSEGDLPDGWREAALSDVLSEPLANGRSVPDAEHGFPVLRLSALRDGRVDLTKRKIGAWTADEAARFNVRRGDFFVARGNGSLALVGRGALLEAEPDPVAFPDTLIRVRVRSDEVDTSWLRLVWNSSVIRRQLESAARTSAGIFKISQQDLAVVSLPVPSLSEQRRIVGRVNELLVRVNAAGERVARAKAILKRFRAAVLAAACSGRLTEEWREAHKLEEPSARLSARIQAAWAARRRGRPMAPATSDVDAPENWPTVSMDALTTATTSGSRAWSKYYRDDGEGTFIMAQNVRPMRFDRTYRLGVSPPARDPERGRTAVEAGDILVTIVGANTGDACRVTDAVREHYVCQSVAYMRPVLTELSPFLELWLNSPLHGRAQYDEWIYGEGRPHLSLDHLRETAVALPSLEEQSEIVRLVGALFTLAETIERRVTGASARADKITEAILAKAFRGDLSRDDCEMSGDVRARAR